MSQDFDAEIADAERRAEELKAPMKDALDRWLDAAGPWLAERWEQASKSERSISIRKP